jgi:hypothetical protein
MKIESLKPGMTVYDVGRTKMGNTTISTVSVWRVHIVSVDLEKRTVEASWNGNTAKTFRERSWSKWRAKEPLLIRGRMGYARMATREEVAAHKKATAEAAAENTTQTNGDVP